jgi:hypothetical protein
VSVAPLPAIGLADHTIVPEVAEPLADWVAPPPPLDELLLLLPPQPARASAPVTPTMAVSCQPLTGRLPGFLRDPMLPPLCVVDSSLYVIALAVERPVTRRPDDGFPLLSGSSGPAGLP